MTTIPGAGPLTRAAALSATSRGTSTTCGSCSTPTDLDGLLRSFSRSTVSLFVSLRKLTYQAQAFERQHGKPELERLLFPRTKGFASTIQGRCIPPALDQDVSLIVAGLRGSHVKYLYDLTLLYTSPGKDVERVPSLSEQLSIDDLALAGYKYRIHVRRFVKRQGERFEHS
jgi:hypothetical protein